LDSLFLAPFCNKLRIDPGRRRIAEIPGIINPRVIDPNLQRSCALSHISILYQVSPTIRLQEIPWNRRNHIEPRLTNIYVDENVYVRYDWNIEVAAALHSLQMVRHSPERWRHHLDSTVRV